MGHRGQGRAHEVLQMAQAQLRQAHASMKQLVSTYKKLRVRQPRLLVRVHALDEEERKNLRKIKHFRKKRLNVEAKIRLIQRRLLEKSGKEVKLKVKVRRASRRYLSRKRSLVQKFKHTEMIVKKIWKQFTRTKKKESVLRKQEKGEVRRVARQLKKLNLQMAAYSRRSRQLARLKRVRFQTALKAA